MIHYFFIHPNATKYFFRRRSDILEENLNKIRKYSGHDFRLYVDYDSIMLYDATDNKVFFYEPITRAMDKPCLVLGELRDLWHYLKNPEIITNQERYNHFVKLQNKYYYE